MDALDTYDAARLPVPAPAACVVAAHPNQRQRFYVQLAPGETTIVSWKALVREANNGGVSVDSSAKTLVREANTEVVSRDSSDKASVQEANNEDASPESFDEDQVKEYIQVMKSRIEESGSVVKGDNVQHRTGRKESFKSSKVQGKKMRKEIQDSVTSAANRKLQEKKSAEPDLQPRSSMSTKVSPTLGGETIKEEMNRDCAVVLLETPREFSSSAVSSHTSTLLASGTKRLVRRIRRYHFTLSLLDQSLVRRITRYHFTVGLMDQSLGRRINRYPSIVSLSDQSLPRNYCGFTRSQLYVKPLPLVGITSNNTRSRGGGGDWETSSIISI